MKEVHLLPGFLGKATDWQIDPNNVSNCLGLDLSPYTCVAHDVDFCRQSLWEWAEGFNQQIAMAKRGVKRVLVGYSLGGRLAMHALLRNPELWSAGVMISSHPGLANEKGRKQRRASDLHWAARFREEPWDLLMQAWNGQGVLASSLFQFERREQDYSREALAALLEHWSLGQQNALALDLQNLNLPLLWMVGERDASSLRLATSLTFQHPRSRVRSIPNAGHRVPWEQTTLFIQQLKEFLEWELSHTIGRK